MSNTTPESPLNDPANESSPDAAAGSVPAEPEWAKEADASESAASEDTFTGEVNVPAEPRSASGHVSAPATGETQASDEAATRRSDDTAATETYAAAPAAAAAPVAQNAWTAEPTTTDSAATGPTTTEPATVAAPAASTVYVSTPTPPKNKGNRGAGILIAVLATVVFAVVYALVVTGIFALNRQGDVFNDLTRYVVTPAFWATAIVFFLAFILLIAIANRGGWWWYVIGGFFVGVIVYFGYIGATLLTNAWDLAPSEVGRFVGQLWAHPLTLAAAIVAREVTVWFGAWIAARGRKVRARNIEAREAYDREVAEGPQYRQPVAGRP
jgi:hypothetical protein